MAKSLTSTQMSAEWDAHTLMRAEVIKGDVKRLAAAQKAARKLAEEEAAEARAMKKVAQVRNSILSKKV